MWPSHEACFQNTVNECGSLICEWDRRIMLQGPKMERFGARNLSMSTCKVSEMAVDPLMKDIGTLGHSTTRSRPFFGSIDGTWQVFPDSRDEELAVESVSSDPRTRPWYRVSTSVVKVVVVLIDLSPSMTNNVCPGCGSGTLLEAAKSITAQLLLTLNAGDHVNIVVFDGDGAVQLAPLAVLVRSRSADEQPELEPLRVELSKLHTAVGSNDQQPSDLNAAILAALPNFDANSLAAKVILVITNGMFTISGKETLPTSKLMGIKVFIYKLLSSSSMESMDYVVIQELCTIGGHFESISTSLENPLLALHNYFSYLANLKRILTKGRPQYSFVHQDLEGFGGNIILVTKPVFWKNDFLGVAGVSIYIELLGSLTNKVNQALQSKITNYGNPMAPLLLSTANCTIVNDIHVEFPKNVVRLGRNVHVGINSAHRPSNKGHYIFKIWRFVMGATITLAMCITIFRLIFPKQSRIQAFCGEYASTKWPIDNNELKSIEENSIDFLDYYKLAIDSITLVQKIVEEATIRPLQLNDGQCKVVAQELSEVRDFLLAKSDWCISNQIGKKALQELYYAIKKAKLLVEKCSCKSSNSWVVSAMTLVDIEEWFMAIILDIQLWRMVVDIVISSANTTCHHKPREMLMNMDEECEEIYKKLHRSDSGLRKAAFEDKKNVILKLQRLREQENNLEYPYVIHLLIWLGQFEDGIQVLDLNHQERLTNFSNLVALGSGGCGTVFGVSWLGLRCALKILRVKDEREATSLKGLSHPNIIRLYHHWEAPIENPTSHLLMELMVVDLAVYIQKIFSKVPCGTSESDNMMPFSLPVAIDIMLQVAQAMQYLHERHLAHRDLKTSNILVKQMHGDLTNFSRESYLEIKLADFGLAKVYNNTSTDNRHTINVGTPVYGAPEIFGKDLVAQRNFPPMADVWSFGVTCAEILSGKKPYAGEKRKTLQSRIANENLRPSLPKCCPPYLAFCISSCWEFQPQRRPNFVSICKMLRHAKLLSLNLTNLDDSEMFLGYTTHRNCVKSFSKSS